MKYTRGIIQSILYTDFHQISINFCRSFPRWAEPFHLFGRGSWHVAAVAGPWSWHPSQVEPGWITMEYSNNPWLLMVTYCYGYSTVVRGGVLTIITIHRYSMIFYNMIAWCIDVA